MKKGENTTKADQSWQPEIDLDRRVLRNAIFGTTGVATDGRIVLPRGIDFQTYLSNPIITCQHVVLQDPGNQPSEPIVIARTLKMHSDDSVLCGDEVQFADSELGRQYAYLYGVNSKREAYMRMWSIEANPLESSVARFDQAKTIAGTYWNENVANRIMRRQKDIPVVTKSVLVAVAAATLGADRDALTRAQAAGIRVAGELITRIDLNQAHDELSVLKETISGQDARIAHLEQQIQALGRDGAAAATRSDSAAVLEEIRTMIRNR